MLSQSEQKNNAGQAGAVSWQGLSFMLVAIIIIAIVFFLLYPREVSDPAVTPGKTEADVPLTTKEERGDTAREIIDQLRDLDGPAGLDKAYVRAQDFHREGRLADAQLLLFFAARGGHGPAAFELATLYDPNYHSSESSLMEDPDPVQAYKWYRQAQEAGHAETARRPDQLQSWARAAAAEGDMNADQLLLIWEE